MADAQSDWPEQERTLRALFRSLKACMILTWERQEKISCNDLESLEMSFEKEGPGFAQTIFDEDMQQADQSQVLKRRAVVVAHLVGEAMSSYARSHSPLDDPWMAWRREPADEPAGEFVHSLKEEEFFCARVAYHIHAATNIRRPECVPSDGDLEDIPGYLETDYAGTWPQWLEVLGPAGDATALYPASAAAKQDLEERPAHSDSKVERDLADLKDTVLAFQMPTIERLESIGAKVDALGAPDRLKTEESLKETLGVEVYSSLCDDARTAALDAERRFRDRETLDWNSVTAELAKAFEIQIKERFVRPLAEFLRQRGIKVFPDNEPLPDRLGKKRPIIRGGQALPKASLGEIEMALGSPLAQLQEFGGAYGFDLAALKKLIHETSEYRNPAAHETGMSYAQVSRLRNEWLGVTARDGGIFGALLPRTG